MKTNLQETSLEALQFYDTVVETPFFDTGLRLSGANVWLKDETAQPVGSFKIRGAYRAAQLIGQDQLQAGIVTASAGNHGQGIALAAQKLGSQAYIYVPESTPRRKLVALDKLGAKVVQVAGGVDEALDEAHSYARASGAAFIHPFNDNDVIDGQSTLIQEILDNGAPDRLFVPVGGGGMLAGACRAVSRTSAATELYGVQLEGADAFAKSLDQGSLVTLPEVNTLSDGTAVKTAGSLALKEVLACSSFSEAIVISEAQLGEAMILQEALTGIAAEPAGSLAFAGMLTLAAKGDYPGETWAGVISGRHRDQERYHRLVAAANHIFI
ncbi:MAG: pyridoxal-phosphate dependent enzyme [Candidatus Saccharimonadales bacterium]